MCFFSMKRQDWVSPFDGSVYIKSAERVRQLLSTWDWELSGVDPSLYRSVVTTGSNNQSWEQELYVFLENQYSTLKFHGDWTIDWQPGGYPSEIRIIIHVDRVDVTTINGSMSFEVERAWSEYELLLPEQFILDVEFDALDAGSTTGTILYNSGSNELLAPLSAPGLATL